MLSIENTASLRPGLRHRYRGSSLVNWVVNRSQHGLEFFPGVEEPGHYCPDREVQNFGDLLILQVFSLLQDDDSAMFWRKLYKSRVDVLTDLSASMVGTGTKKRRGNSMVKFYLRRAALPAK